MRQNRREFIKTCGIISAGALCGGYSVLISGCSSVKYIQFTAEDNAFVVRKIDMAEQPFALIKSRQFTAPIYIARLAEDDYSAVLLECTHKKCEVSAGAELLICPCHGSEFSITGEVLNPPAERALHKFTVGTDAENIYIKVF